MDDGQNSRPADSHSGRPPYPLASRRRVLAWTAAVAVAAGGAQLSLFPAWSVTAAPAPDCVPDSGEVTCTYEPHEGDQLFTVPAGVDRITVTALGAGGYGGSFGAKVTGTLGVRPGDILHVMVGGTGIRQSGGFNGGGPGVGPKGGGGGGATSLQACSGTDIQCTSSYGSADEPRLLVAGGGGGSGARASGTITVGGNASGASSDFVAAHGGAGGTFGIAGGGGGSGSTAAGGDGAADSGGGAGGVDSIAEGTFGGRGGAARSDTAGGGGGAGTAGGSGGGGGAASVGRGGQAQGPTLISYVNGGSGGLIPVSTPTFVTGGNGGFGTGGAGAQPPNTAASASATPTVSSSNGAGGGGGGYTGGGGGALGIASDAGGGGGGAGSSYVSPAVTDARAGTADDVTGSLTITYTTAPMLTPATVPPAMVGQQIPPTQLVSAQGGTPPYHYTVDGTLPPGLSVSEDTATLSGTPTAANPRGSDGYVFTVHLTDARGRTADQPFHLPVAPAGTTTTLSGSLNPPTAGRPVLLTATLTGAQHPTGTVTFTDSVYGTLCADVPLSGTAAACPSGILTAGSHSFTATYSGDLDNSSSSGTLDQRAAYGVGPFQPPISPSEVNRVKAGQSVPVKFVLLGNPGLGILNAAPTISSHPCAGGVPSTEVETASSADTGLVSLYDPATDTTTYTYVWKSPKNAAGCATFTLPLNDRPITTAPTIEFRYR